MKKLEMDVYRAVDKYRVWYKIETDETTIGSVEFEREHRTGPRTEMYSFEVASDRSSHQGYFDAPGEHYRRSLQPGDIVHMTVNFDDDTKREASYTVPDQYPNPVASAQPVEITIRIAGGQVALG